MKEPAGNSSLLPLQPEWYRRLFETAKDGILILDAESGKVLDSNPFMTEMLGYPPVEFLGKELWEIGLFRDKSENESAFRQLQRDGYIRYDHLPLKTRSGQAAEVEFVSNVYHVDHQRVAQCNIRDISERSRREEQARAQATELSDLHRRKDEFLAMLSHELRSPLAPILNAVQLLRLQQETENLIQQQARAIIERQLGLLKRLVDDLLEISRITTGRIQLRQERVAMGGIVESAVESVGPLIGRRRHELTFTSPPEPIWVHADAARLEQVVVNLLSNAAKYTDEGGHIWLTLQQERSECVLRVRDTGVGISPEILPRIFDLFTQAEPSMARSQGGLGVGLALAQRLTQLHGGSVEAQSALGHGSEFIVRLPIATTPPQQPQPPPEEPKPTGPQLRVLVVDDSVDTALSLAMLLKESGHDVWTAHDGAAAMRAALDYRPDVVLLDIGLPGPNGYEVAKWFRQQPDLLSVVLVALTGYGQESDRKASGNAGFDYHLVKPTGFKDVHEILATVSARLEKER
jgi:PAS domain S-box-containing protein